MTSETLFLFPRLSPVVLSMPSRKASAGKKKVEKEIESSPPGQLVPLPSVFNLFPLSRPHDTRTSSTRDSPPSSTFPLHSLFLTLKFRPYFVAPRTAKSWRIVDFLKEHKRAPDRCGPPWKGLRKPRAARVRLVNSKKIYDINCFSEKKEKKKKEE